MVSVRFMRPAELPMAIAQAAETALAQVVDRERPGASRDRVAAQLAQMYYRVLQLPQSAVLVAEVDAGQAAQSVAGHVLLMPQPNPFTGEGELVVMDIYTNPAFRGRGIGRAMLAQARVYALHVGCKSLAAQVALHNAASLALFRSSGFQTERVTVGLRC